jgi:hypothetical protein
MSAKFEYRGNLAETPLPTMLVKIHRYRVPGVLTAQRREVAKRVYMRDGNVVFATSNDLNDSLGVFMMKQGMLTREQFDESARRLKAEGKRQGEVLIEMGAVTPERLTAAVASQVSSILWSLFDWDEGEVTFEVGRFRADEKIQIAISVPDVVRDGLMKVADAKVLVKKIGPSWTILERVPDAVAGIELDPAEDLFLSVVDGRTPLLELCRKGPGDIARSARVLYLFLCLDLIRRKAESSAKKFQWRTEGKVR